METWRLTPVVIGYIISETAIDMYSPVSDHIIIDWPDIVEMWGHSVFLSSYSNISIMANP